MTPAKERLSIPLRMKLHRPGPWTVRCPRPFNSFEDETAYGDHKVIQGGLQSFNSFEDETKGKEVSLDEFFDAINFQFL